MRLTTTPFRTTVNGHSPQEDETNNEDLTPPPDSPIVDDIMSPTTSIPVNTLQDEIVVGTKAHHSDAGKTSPIGVASDQEDIEMDEEADEQADEQLITSHYPKRKRASIFNDLSEDKIESSLVEEEQGRRLPKISRPARAHGVGGVKGVVLGYWRDSPVADEKDKHAVIGFIDVRDRLRTRIQPTNREGKNISIGYPLPPGPGGSWVTFERVAFDPHLVNLDHYQVKEYVKIRAETVGGAETSEEREMLNTEAVTEAIRRVQAHPPPETSVVPPVAYGPQIPEHAQMSNRPESKKRRLASGIGLPVTNTTASPTRNQQLENIPRSRPTRILLGFWKKSSADSNADKHAVYGILGANDMFRVKLVRETRDGRTMLGNFPVGPGGLWIHWNEVEFEPHLQLLSRNDIKEYCRIRQAQMDEGESPSERGKNEIAAARDAQLRAPHKLQGRRDGPAGGAPPATPELILANDTDPEDNNTETSAPALTQAKLESEVHAPRLSRRENPSRARHSLPDVQLRAANRPLSVDRLERTNSLARREIARAEAVQMRADQRSASRGAATPAPAPPSATNKSLFQDNVQRLNKVWAAQEAHRLRDGAEDAKIYMGIKYERKQNGPFEGKLVSQGTIISIDGEDYVEYRVLTKPTFF